MNIINKLTFITATFIAGCVLLVSIHAKDIVKYTDTSTASRVVYNDISKKAVGELHDHVDKQVVKSLVKTFIEGFSEGVADAIQEAGVSATQFNKAIQQTDDKSKSARISSCTNCCKSIPKAR